MYLCHFVFLSLVFQHWAKVYKQIFCCIAVLSIYSRLKRPKLYQMQVNAMQVNAHHFDKNDGLLTCHQMSCNFCTETIVLIGVRIGLLVLSIIILISLSALRPSFYTRFLIVYFVTFH